MKVVCVNNYTYNGFEEEMCKLLPVKDCVTPKWYMNKTLIIGKIYEVEPHSDYSYWLIKEHTIFKKSRFITLAEWREQQINEILK